MTDEELLELFTQILRDLLGDDTIAVKRETTRADVPGWDSFNYVNFIVAVEAKLGIKFRIADVESFETIGDILADSKVLLADEAE